jgi:hypothetical protein
LEKHGEWTILFRSNLLPFKKRKADRLVLIGRTFGPEAPNASNWTHLPSSWRTLYHLAQIGLPIVLQLISQGRIHPRLTLRQAKALLAEFRPDAANAHPPSLKQWLARIAGFLRKNAASWTAEERRSARTGLTRMAARLRERPCQTAHG